MLSTLLQYIRRLSSAGVVARGKFSLSHVLLVHSFGLTLGRLASILKSNGYKLCALRLAHISEFELNFICYKLYFLPTKIFLSPQIVLAVNPLSRERERVAEGRERVARF